MDESHHAPQTNWRMSHSIGRVVINTNTIFKISRSFMDKSCGDCRDKNLQDYIHREKNSNVENDLIFIAVTTWGQ